MISIINISQLKDNYCYLIRKGYEIIIIDPADSAIISKYIDDYRLTLKAILLTHHHKDHTAGVEGLLNKYEIPVYSPNKEIKYTSNIIRDNDNIDFGFIKIKVISTPGHTLDHVVLYSKENNILFSGDTLFRLGCGRVFEGTYEQMFNSLKKIYSLNNKTTVYCGHEYTSDNLNFLLSVFPENDNLLIEKKEINIQLKEKKSSIPFNLGKEKRLNPFLGVNSDLFSDFKIQNNLSSFELFSHLRDLKNNY